MLRSQSINACVDEIIQFNVRRQFLKINIIGMSGSGKTTLMTVLAHQIHKASTVPYEVKFFKDDQLANFTATVQDLSNNNQILCFDDLSGFLEHHGKAALQKLKAELTTVRHINDQEDRKIIMMLSFHAQKMLDKNLRISNFAFYTDCQLEEIDYLIDLLGKKHKQKIEYFQKLKAQAGLKHQFSYMLSKGNKFTYKDGDPFQAMLYNNGVTTRHVVSPLLSWILKDDKCTTCNPPIDSTYTKINLDQFVIDFNKKFGKGIAKRAVELKLLQQGKMILPKRVAQARMYIEQYLTKREFELSNLAEFYGLDEERMVRLHSIKQPVFAE